MGDGHQRSLVILSPTHRGGSHREAKGIPKQASLCTLRAELGSFGGRERRGLVYMSRVHVQGTKHFLSSSHPGLLDICWLLSPSPAQKTSSERHHTYKPQARSQTHYTGLPLSRFMIKTSRENF